MAMMVLAPARREPMIAASPTPPHPITATESPRPTLPVFIAATHAGHDAATEQSDDSRIGRGVDLGALAFVNQRLVCECADAECRRQFGAVFERHLLLGR